MSIRTVTLELLRHGPAHNQLLSPLTPYLALCGNHDPETVSVGFEHLQLVRTQRKLRYAQGVELAEEALGEAAREVGRLLGSIRSLISELASSDPRESRRMVHLRLVLSASELALLPFEVVESAPGLPGQGQPLALQTVTPVCLTREVRRVAASTLRWPQQPRILLVSAAPPPVTPVPLSEHVEALRAALAPYLGSEEEFDKQVTVLPEATLDKVQEACRQGDYTHVHVLAHGMEDGGPGLEERYGLAFHSSADPNAVDVVTGRRLAAALRSHKSEGSELARPVVVSIASCDSGNMGSVVAPGGSVAHTLHEEGIPLVVASQFPLTVEGSIVMTRVLYERLLRGDDPRIISHDLRQSLYVQCQGGHDWASVVMYAALPGNLDTQLEHVRFERARRALEAAMARVEKAQGKAAPEPEKEREALDKAMQHFEKVALQQGPERVKTWGVLASAWKQVARFRQGNPEEFRQALEKARSYYFKCYQAGVGEAWPQVQYLSLTVALEHTRDTACLRRRCEAAAVVAEDNITWGEPWQRAWAHSSLAELALLSALWEEDAEACKRRALEQLQRMFDLTRMGLYPAEQATFDERSTLRQLKRYMEWKTYGERLAGIGTALCEEMERRGVRLDW